METDPPDATPAEPSFEICSERRIAEFDAAEVELAEVLPRMEK